MANQSIARSQISDALAITIASKVLEYMISDIVFARLALTNFSNELKKKGETIVVPSFSGFVAKDKSAQTAIELQDGTIDGVEVTLDKWKYASAILEDDVMDMEAIAMDRFAKAEANALVEQIESDLITALSAPYFDGTGTIATTDTDATVTGTGTAFTTELAVGYKVKTAGGQILEVDSITDDTHFEATAAATADEATAAFTFMQQVVWATAIDLDNVIDSRKILRKQKAAMGEIVMVNNVDDYATLLKTGDLQGADSINASLLRDGQVGRIAGLNTFESNKLETAYSICMAQSALGVAFRTLAGVPEGLGVKSQVITDPVSGLALRYTYGYSMQYMGVQMTFDVLYGTNLLEPKKVLHIAEAS